MPTGFRGNFSTRFFKRLRNVPEPWVRESSGNVPTRFFVFETLNTLNQALELPPCFAVERALLVCFIRESGSPSLGDCEFWPAARSAKTDLERMSVQR